MKQEDLILSSIMDIKEDIGKIKGIQSSLQSQMDVLDKSMESLELACNTTPAIQISRNQIITGISALIIAIGGLGASL